MGGRVNTEKEVTGEGFPIWGHLMGNHRQNGKRPSRLQLPYSNPMG